MEIARRDQPAVAQHRHPLADLEHLMQPVRDVNDGDAFCLELLDDGEEPLDLRRRQCRRRLVQHEELAVIAQRLGDLDQLHLGNAERLDARPRIDVEADLLEQRDGAPVERLAVDDAEGAAWQVFQHQILGDAEIRQKVELLMHDADAALLRIVRRLRLVGRAVEGDRAAVRLVDAGQELDQRRLAGAVLAEHDMGFAACDRQRDVAQRDDASGIKLASPALCPDAQSAALPHVPPPSANRAGPDCL